MTIILVSDLPHSASKVAIQTAVSQPILFVSAQKQMESSTTCRCTGFFGIVAPFGCQYIAVADTTGPVDAVVAEDEQRRKVSKHSPARSSGDPLIEQLRHLATSIGFCTDCRNQLKSDWV